MNIIKVEKKYSIVNICEERLKKISPISTAYKSVVNFDDVDIF